MEVIVNSTYSTALNLGYRYMACAIRILLAIALSCVCVFASVMKIIEFADFLVL